MTSNPRLHARFDLLLLAALAGLAACEGGGAPIGPSVDSNSNWLIQCHSHADCAADEGVCMTGICLQPQLFAADYDSQRCVDVCADSVNAHLLEPCLESGEPSDVCSAHASELLATCRVDCARRHGTGEVDFAGGGVGTPERPPSVDADPSASVCWRSCVDLAFPELTVCRAEGRTTDEECMNAFYDTVNACGASCGSEADVLEGSGAGSPEDYGPERALFEGYTCDTGALMLQNPLATQDEAVEVCAATMEANPGLFLVCTWNGFTVLNGCEEAGSPEVVESGYYLGARCSDSTPFIQSFGVSREVALESCRENAALNAQEGGIAGGVICTWNGELLYESCEDSPAMPSPKACEGWEPAAFDRADEFIDTTYWPADEMNCDGASFRRFDARYGLWVGLVSCGVGYRFFLSETADGSYLPAADYGGHGQDLCELLDPDFSISLEDIITSGGCTECAIGHNYSFVAGEVFARGTFGQSFTRGEAPAWGPLQSSVSQCATGPLECALSMPLADCALDPLGCPPLPTP